MVFPVMSGYIASYQGVETLFYLLVGVLAVSATFIALFRKTLTLLSS
jgi:hypothetical protein